MNAKPTLTNVRACFVNALGISYALSIYDKKKLIEKKPLIPLFQCLVSHVI